MYAGPIVDPHMHLWDLSMHKHAWLAPSGGVAALGGIDKLRRNFLPADYLAVSANQPVAATVHVEALWDRADIVGETRWLETLDKSRNIAGRYIAAAPLGTPDAAKIIAEQAKFSRVVGIRDILSFHPTLPAKSFAPRDGIAFDPAWRADAFRLVEHGLLLELMMYPYQLAGVLDLARARRDLQIVVNHCASPIDRDAAGMARWRDTVTALGQEPNIALKISAIAGYDPEPTDDSIAAVALHCIASFGAERAMFATDWPVASLSTGYDAIWNGFRRVTANLSEATQRALFCDTARRIYRF